MSSTPGSATGTSSGGRRTHRAGAFDIRNFIGALIGVYGVILVLTGLFAADGRTINLASGAGMVVVAVVFLVWARLRPVVVPDDPADAADGSPDA